MNRLKNAKEVREWRERTLAEQGGVCALCGLPLKSEDAVADHNHKHGWMRGVLHRGCNSLLGKIENNWQRVGVPDIEKFLNGCYFYILIGNVPSLDVDVYHPSHRTAEEKRLRRNKKARLARKKARKQTYE